MVKLKTGKGNAPAHRLRGIDLPNGLGTIDELHAELQSMINVLLDRVPAPVDNNNPLGLMTVANAYFARASEMAILIYAMERDGRVKGGRGSDDPYHLFRTGELNVFMEMAKKSVDEGSRRLSAAQLEHDRTVRGLDAAGWGG